MALIELCGVSKRYGNLDALIDLNLNIEKGCIMALLGPSGCGKTTTLRLIAGLETPDSGYIRLDGRYVAGDNHWVPPEERQVGMVFQDYALFPHLTVEANIAFALHKLPRRERQARIAEMLDIVGLPDLAERYPHQISGGQGQRVALARALAPGPSVVLLDEPFSNLDAVMRTSTREEVQSILQQTGTTAVFVTHDQEEAMSIADMLGVMVGGQLLQMGPPRSLYEDPISPEVALFLGDANRLQGTGHGHTADSALGTLGLRHPHTGPVQIFIRPENMRLSSEPGSTPAYIERVFYYGSYQTVQVILADGTRLKARTESHEIYRPGEAIGVQVSGLVLAFSPSLTV